MTAGLASSLSATGISIKTTARRCIRPSEWFHPPQNPNRIIFATFLRPVLWCNRVMVLCSEPHN